MKEKKKIKGKKKKTKENAITDNTRQLFHIIYEELVRHWSNVSNNTRIKIPF